MSRRAAFFIPLCRASPWAIKTKPRLCTKGANMQPFAPAIAPRVRIHNRLRPADAGLRFNSRGACPAEIYATTKNRPPHGGRGPADKPHRTNRHGKLSTAPTPVRGPDNWGDDTPIPMGKPIGYENEAPHPRGKGTNSHIPHRHRCSITPYGCHASCTDANTQPLRPVIAPRVQICNRLRPAHAGLRLNSRGACPAVTRTHHEKPAPARGSGPHRQT